MHAHLASYTPPSVPIPFRSMLSTTFQNLAALSSMLAEAYCKPGLKGMREVCLRRIVLFPGVGKILKLRQLQEVDSPSAPATNHQHDLTPAYFVPRDCHVSCHETSNLVCAIKVLPPPSAALSYRHFPDAATPLYCCCYSPSPLDDLLEYHPP